MTSLGILSRLTVSSLLVVAAACADTITQGDGDLTPAPSASGSAPDAGSDAARPILNIQASDGKHSVFQNGGPGSSPPGSFYTIEVNGTGFPAGVDFSARAIGVTSDGSRHEFVRSLGVHPADGTYRSIHGASCPSRFREIYEVVNTGGMTTESKRVAPTC